MEIDPDSDSLPPPPEEDEDDLPPPPSDDDILSDPSIDYDEDDLPPPNSFSPPQSPTFDLESIQVQKYNLVKQKESTIPFVSHPKSLDQFSSVMTSIKSGVNLKPVPKNPDLPKPNQLGIFNSPIVNAMIKRRASLTQDSESEENSGFSSDEDGLVITLSRIPFRNTNRSGPSFGSRSNVPSPSNLNSLQSEQPNPHPTLSPSFLSLSAPEEISAFPPPSPSPFSNPSPNPSIQLQLSSPPSSLSSSLPSLQDIEDEIRLLLSLQTHPSSPPSLSSLSSFQTQNKLEQLFSLLESHPQHRERERKEREAWREDQKGFALESYLETLRYLPPLPSTSSIDSLQSQARYSPALAKRLLTHQALWLLRMSPASLLSLHPSDLTHRFSIRGLDLVETAALYHWACLPFLEQDEAKIEGEEGRGEGGMGGGSTSTSTTNSSSRRRRRRRSKEDLARAEWREGVEDALREMLACLERDELPETTQRNPAYDDQTPFFTDNEGNPLVNTHTLFSSSLCSAESPYLLNTNQEPNGEVQASTIPSIPPPLPPPPRLSMRPVHSLFSIPLEDEEEEESEEEEEGEGVDYEIEEEEGTEDRLQRENEDEEEVKGVKGLGLEERGVGVEGEGEEEGVEEGVESKRGDSGERGLNGGSGEGWREGWREGLMAMNLLIDNPALDIFISSHHSSSHILSPPSPTDDMSTPLDKHTPSPSSSPIPSYFIPSQSRDTFKKKGDEEEVRESDEADMDPIRRRVLQYKQRLSALSSSDQSLIVRVREESLREDQERREKERQMEEQRKQEREAMRWREKIELEEREKEEREREEKRKERESFIRTHRPLNPYYQQPPSPSQKS